MANQPNIAPHPLLLVISGPSGVGKDVLLSQIKASGAPYFFTITTTTRARRDGERDGVEYHFVSKRRFEAMIASGELLEWATVYGNYYGVPKDQVTDALSRGKDVIIKIDVQGAATIRKIAPDALFIFLAPPSEKELKRRLRGRKSESDTALALRMKQARREMQEAKRFDYVVVHHTDRTDEAVREITDIIERERRRMRPLGGLTDYESLA